MGSGVLSEGKSHLRLSEAPVCVSMHVRTCVTAQKVTQLISSVR